MMASGNGRRRRAFHLHWLAALIVGIGGCRLARVEEPPPRPAAGKTYEAPLDVRKTHDARLIGTPSVARADGGVRIRFEVSRPVDVEVAVLDADGRVVRHLAAGLLGPRAPEPLQKDRLKQELVWGGRGDAGRAAARPAHRRVSRCRRSPAWRHRPRSDRRSARPGPSGPGIPA